MKRITEAQLRAELEALAKSTKPIDFSDMPEVTDWSNAVRGRFYRPVKRQITLRIDSDILAHFQRGGPGYQTRINEALRKLVNTK